MPFATDGQEKWFAGYTKDTTLGEVRSDYESAFSSQNPDTALRERFEQWLLGEGSPVAVKKYVLAAFQALLLKKTDSNKFKCRIIPYRKLFCNFSYAFVNLWYNKNKKYYSLQ